MAEQNGPAQEQQTQHERPAVTVDLVILTIQANDLRVLLVSRGLHAGTDAAEVRWFSAYHLPALAFDHARIVDVALRRVRSKLDWTPIAFRLLPEQFTMSQLRNVYQIILDRELDKQNFSKK